MSSHPRHIPSQESQDVSPTGRALTAEEEFQIRHWVFRLRSLPSAHPLTLRLSSQLTNWVTNRLNARQQEHAVGINLSYMENGVVRASSAAAGGRGSQFDSVDGGGEMADLITPEESAIEDEEPDNNEADAFWRCLIRATAEIDDDGDLMDTDHPPLDVVAEVDGANTTLSMDLDSPHSCGWDAAIDACTYSPEPVRIARCLGHEHGDASSATATAEGISAATTDPDFPVPLPRSS